MMLNNDGLMMIDHGDSGPTPMDNHPGVLPHPHKIDHVWMAAAQRI